MGNFPRTRKQSGPAQKKRTRNEGKIIHQPTNTPVIHRTPPLLVVQLSYPDLRSTLPASGRDDFQSILISHGFRSQLSSLMVEEVKGMREGRSLLNSCQLLLKAPLPAPHPPHPGSPGPPDGALVSKEEQKKTTLSLSKQHTSTLLPADFGKRGGKQCSEPARGQRSRAADGVPRTDAPEL